MIFTCYGGYTTGVAASKACIRLWEENPVDVKIGCLSAIIVPWKLNEIMKKSGKRILIDAWIYQVIQREVDALLKGKVLGKSH